MALSRVKTWIAEVLYYADLNAEFNNILNNGAGSLSSPRTASFDLDGYTCIVDSDGDTYIQATADDLIDLYGQSTLLFRFDMDATTPVNALSFVASATGTATSIEARGSDTNISINIVPKGTGVLQVGGSAVAATEDANTILANQVFA